MAAMYAVYHGPEGIKNIAEKVNRDARVLAAGLGKLGYKISHQTFFDTVRVDLGNKKASDVAAACQKRGINVRSFNDNTVTVSMDETVTERDLKLLFEAFAESASAKINFTPADLAKQLQPNISGKLARTTPFLTHPHFNTHHSETHMMRYLKRLENRDISLTNTMIPLGSCTMKLNAASEMYPVTWPGETLLVYASSQPVAEFGNLHPFAPLEQVLLSNKHQSSNCSKGARLHRNALQSDKRSLQHHWLRCSVSSAQCRKSGRICWTQSHPCILSKRWTRT